MKREEPSQIFDDIDDVDEEESDEFYADDIDDDLYDCNDVDNGSDDRNYSPYLNNIFPISNNLHHKHNKLVLKSTIDGFREVSLTFSLYNINRILSVYGIAFKDVSLTIAKYGKSKPNYSDVEVERIVNSYFQCVPHSEDVSYVITSFINMWKDGTVNKVISFYISNDKGNSNNKYIVCNFNIDSLRELCFGVLPSDKNYNPLDDKEMLVVEDWSRIFWNLYMLLVFHKVCDIAPDNEVSFFEHLHKVVNMVLITGMKMFVQLNLNCSYGEIYQELQGVKAINPKYLYVQDIQEKQQIYFAVKNSDFLTEAYKNEYSGAIAIPNYIKDIKNDKHTDIELWVTKGSTNNSALIEVIFSGQHPIGRVYDCETDPEQVINFINIFDFCPEALKPVLYLFRQMLNYSKDYEVTSYYTELQKYIKQYKGKRTRNLIPKLLNIIILILHKRPTDDELEVILNKYFSETDTVQKTEIRKIFSELKVVLKPKKIRVLDMLKMELARYVW